MIRNFIYLDAVKLRSLSSQLFDGFSEAILRGSVAGVEEKETQKGELGSGKLLADIFRKSSSSTELKFLEDHAYSLFENEINERDILNSINSVEDQKIKSFSFVKVTGELTFNDTLATTKLLSEYNEVGAAYHVTSEIERIKKDAIGKPLTEKVIRASADRNGMQMDATFLSALEKVISFGFSGMLEIQVVKDDFIYSAPLKREFLREKEDFFVQKYSRYPEGEFSLVGLITRSAKAIDADENIPNTSEAFNLRYSLRTLSAHVNKLESVTSGLNGSEVIIDPIAVYRTIS